MTLNEVADKLRVSPTTILAFVDIDAGFPKPTRGEWDQGAVEAWASDETNVVDIQTLESDLAESKAEVEQNPEWRSELEELIAAEAALKMKRQAELRTLLDLPVGASLYECIEAVKELKARTGGNVQ